MVGAKPRRPKRSKMFGFLVKIPTFLFFCGGRGVYFCNTFGHCLPCLPHPPLCPLFLYGLPRLPPLSPLSPLLPSLFSLSRFHLSLPFPLPPFIFALPPPPSAPKSLNMVRKLWSGIFAPLELWSGILEFRTMHGTDFILSLCLWGWLIRFQM